MVVYGAALLLASCLCASLVHGAVATSRHEYLNLLRALQQDRAVGDPHIRARCDLQDNPGLSDAIATANNVQGTVEFRQLNTGGILSVTVRLTGLDVSGAEYHGFHVHEFGDVTTNGCASTGGHFNPFGKQHGAPEDTERHVGDFGNVQRNSDGSVSTDFTDNVASLLGANTIIGRAIVLHKDTDDLGTSDYPDSLTTGHAGARLACCVIIEE